MARVSRNCYESVTDLRTKRINLRAVDPRIFIREDHVMMVQKFSRLEAGTMGRLPRTGGVGFHCSFSWS